MISVGLYNHAAATTNRRDSALRMTDAVERRTAIGYEQERQVKRKKQNTTVANVLKPCILILHNSHQVEKA